jgi:hypothetical protein
MIIQLDTQCWSLGKDLPVILRKKFGVDVTTLLALILCKKSCELHPPRDPTRACDSDGAHPS